MVRWETLGSRRVYESHDFDVVRDRVRISETETEFEYVTEPDAVVVLPFTHDGDVVVVEEWRQAVGRVNTGLPAGSVEPDESAEDAAHRELAEETGYEADSADHLVSVEPSNGLTDTVHHHFVARGCTPTAEQELDDDESIRVSTAPFDGLVESLETGELDDGRTALALLYYRTFV